MKALKYYRFIPILLGMIAFCYFYLYRYVYLNSKYFEQNKINSKIIKVYNYENKSLQFYYTDDYCITNTDTKGDTLKIGDSISKEANTESFKIYRKNQLGKYEFYKNYLMEE
ncbi:hypothetical protein [Chryseobacterium sp. SC28]|uniref:hypothetical protein n=1 Tax=Chryseobacterium sp. SC28 TaxID=2268028 RepID=UPI000F652E16|nr:hypothetical protein [Chryseobacterium sp. SC28]RRQ46196.1 hypothetical protein DTW91_05750 [Chryseobacterium sp. SC28]